MLQETNERCKAFTNLDIKDRQKKHNHYQWQVKCFWSILNVTYRVLRQSIVPAFKIKLYPSSSPSAHWFAQSFYDTHDNKMIYCHCMWTDSRSAWHINLNFKLNFHQWLANIVLAMCSSAGFNISRWLYQQIVCWFGFRVKGMGWRWNGPAIQICKLLTSYSTKP